MVQLQAVSVLWPKAWKDRCTSLGRLQNVLNRQQADTRLLILTGRFHMLSLKIMSIHTLMAMKVSSSLAVGKSLIS